MYTAADSSGNGRGGDFWFNVDEKTGIISTARRIDREELCPRVGQDRRLSWPDDDEELCPRAADCFVKFDVTVQPIQYFQIIKVTSAIIIFSMIDISVTDIRQNNEKKPVG